MNEMKGKLLTLLLLAFNLFTCFGEETDLSGDWTYRLVGAPSSIPGEGRIHLPSTLDTEKKSVYNPPSDITDQLRREFSFVGEATYSRTFNVAKDWEGKDIFLKIERTKPTEVRVDGKRVGSNSRISSPQEYDLTGILTPGRRHTLEIVVNNADSIPPMVARSSHAVSESTQTNWNGILGGITLEARNPFTIRSVKIEEYEDASGAALTVGFSSPAKSRKRLYLQWKDNAYISKEISRGDTSVTLHIPLQEEDLWSGDHPRLHELKFSVKDHKGKIVAKKNMTTGFRKLGVTKDYFTINGRPIFLRGTVNAAVFPITAYAPMDTESWRKYFSVVKDYGFNHVRFHSWTPPEGAFQAADEMGIYIMAELPMWGEFDRDMTNHDRFLREDMKGIMEAYSHHPSFVMFSPGNELWGDISLMGEYMIEGKALNPRLLSTYGSNVYLGMKGQIGKEDFIVAAKTGDDTKKSVRGSNSFADTPTGGILNSTYPNSEFTYALATNGLTVPAVAHEAGQYQIYPDFEEIDKYEGILKPDNLKEFQRRAMEAGMLGRNREFMEASGKWASKLYRAEIEAALRTPGMGGIEIFGLQDYPGQGGAFVGILDPFMETKGLVVPEEWRMAYGGDMAVLAEFPKFTFVSGETVEIPVKTVNYISDPDKFAEIEWSTDSSQGKISPQAGYGTLEIGKITIEMPVVAAPGKMTLSLKGNGGETENHYDFWVYPTSSKGVKAVKVTHNMEEALRWLSKGDKVILMPDSATVARASLDPMFTPDFWNYRMYRTICDEMHLAPSPGTLGLYIDKTHPSLSKFPTDNHTDWQWYPIIENSRPLIIDRLPVEMRPIVEVIDNVERNFRLALMLECKVGKGKLMIISSDLDKASEYPEGKWLLQSVKEYMAGKDFNPEYTLSAEQVRNLLTKPSNARLIREMKNETYRKF